jgi:hypothetical protein
MTKMYVFRSVYIRTYSVLSVAVVDEFVYCKTTHVLDLFNDILS